MTDQNILNTLKDIRDAVGSQQRREATDLFGDLNDQYIEANQRETFRRKQYILAHNQGKVSEEGRRTLSEYVSEATTVQTQRAQLLTEAAKYTSGFNIDRDAFVESITQTESSESNLLKNRRAAEGVQVPKSLPAAVEILNISLSTQPLLKGVSSDATILVGNLGDKEATGVHLSVSNGGGFVVGSNSFNIGGVKDRMPVTTAITGKKSGESQIRVELESDESGTDVESLLFRVIDKQDGIEEAKAHISNALDKLDVSRGNGGGKGNGSSQSFEAKLLNADAKLDDALRFVKNERSKQADNMLTAANRNLGALLNQAAGNGNSERVKFYIEQQVEAAIDSISRARQANI